MSIADVIFITLIMVLVLACINYLRKNKNSCAGCSASKCDGSCHSSNIYEEYKRDKIKGII